ncbi:hypothetical protein PG996_002875 [Apiospora saccharicola]|uniref:Uncharacterized protein n=1 Tax=Apiospora saccharicola TaxID=335842 RepID=A0ABR1WPS9_9PEZI
MITVTWRGPDLHWVYLASTSFLFYAAVPLLGLSVDQWRGLSRSTRLVEVPGVNRTTFNLKSWGNLPETVDKVWRQGNPVDPAGETIFYAPEGISDVGNTYYEDTIQNIYQRQLKDVGSPINQTISFFSGPEVTERAFGSAWGLLTNVSSLLGLPPTRTLNRGPYRFMGISKLFYGKPTHRYNISLARYHSEDMASHPLVARSTSRIDKTTSLGYAVKCAVVSDVEVAKVSADTITFKDFQREPVHSNQIGTNTDGQVVDWQGAEAIQAIVHSALTGLALHYDEASKCNSKVSKTCNPWMGASMTLELAIYAADTFQNGFHNINLQMPLIIPEQMTLAMHKIFGVAAASMMAPGSGNWTSEGGLYGLDPANDLVIGRVPYQIVGVILVVWAVLTVVTQVWALLFWGLRWAATLDSFVLFRLGAEWRDAVHNLTSDNLGASGTDSLMKVPGLVGEMQRDNNSREDVTGPHGSGHPLLANMDNSIGFVGLSDESASTKKEKLYSWN